MGVWIRKQVNHLIAVSSTTINTIKTYSIVPRQSRRYSFSITILPFLAAICPLAYADLRTAANFQKVIHLYAPPELRRIHFELADAVKTEWRSLFANNQNLV